MSSERQKKRKTSRKSKLKFAVKMSWKVIEFGE